MECNQCNTFSNQNSCTAGTYRELLTMDEKATVWPLVTPQNRTCMNAKPI